MSKSYRYNPHFGEERPDKYTRAERAKAKEKRVPTMKERLDEVFDDDQDDLYADDERNSPNPLRS